MDRGRLPGQGSAADEALIARIMVFSVCSWWAIDLDGEIGSLSTKSYHLKLHLKFPNFSSRHKMRRLWFPLAGRWRNRIRGIYFSLCMKGPCLFRTLDRHIEVPLLKLTLDSIIVILEGNRLREPERIGQSLQPQLFLGPSPSRWG